MSAISNSTVVDATDRFITRREFAGLLGVKDETLAQWAWRGSPEIPYFRCGRVVRYRIKDVQRFIDQRMATSAAGHAAVATA
jgi:Helix-turn-helix domain